MPSFVDSAGRKARAAYGFDDMALIPGALTINPSEVDISWADVRQLR